MSRLVNLQLGAQPCCLVVSETAEECARTVAERFVELAQTRSAQQESLKISLAGGRTPQACYEWLATPHLSRKIDWERFHIFFGDERAVATDHPDSNYRMAREALLDQVPIPVNQVHPIPMCPDNLERGADQYENLLRCYLPCNQQGYPVFDLVMLGVGTDGHTASLFPGTEALRETSRWVLANHVPQLDTWRMSLTQPVISAARAIWMLVCGPEKSDILAAVLRGDPSLPATQVLRNHQQVIWFVDKPACSKIPLRGFVTARGE